MLLLSLLLLRGGNAAASGSGYPAQPGFGLLPPPGEPPLETHAELLRWSEAAGAALNPTLALRCDSDGTHGVYATGPIAAGDVLARVPLALAAHRASLEPAFAGAAALPPIARFVLRRGRAQLRQRRGAFGEVFGLAWWLTAVEHEGDGVDVPPLEWGRYIRSLPEEFATALAYEDAELEALAGTHAGILARELRDEFDAEYRAAERGWQRCRELQEAEFDACAAPWPFVVEEFSWAASMVLSRAFFVDAPLLDAPAQDAAAESAEAAGSAEVEADTSALMLLPVADLFNHGAQSLSRTVYDAESNSLLVVTSTPFDDGEEVTINYGNHSVSDFLVRYGFVPKGQLRSVVMDLVPWPPAIIKGTREAMSALGGAALRPFSSTETGLLSRVLVHRDYPSTEKLTLFKHGLDKESNFALRMRHLRDGGELSGYCELQYKCRLVWNFPLRMQQGYM